MLENKYTILLLGGTGFVGKRICYDLAAQGHRLIVLSRRPERHRDLEVLPNLTLKKANIHDESSLSYYFREVDVVINLVGILNAHDFSNKEFEKVHVDLLRKIISACKIQQVKQLIHFSAIGADAKSAPSEYLRTKGKAEDIIIKAQSEDFHATIFRPSLIMGMGAGIIQQFRTLLKWAPGVLILPCASSLYSPVSVDDVTHAVAHSIGNLTCFNKRFDLCGPTTYSLKKIVQLIAQGMQKKCLIIGLNPFLSLCLSYILQFFPGKPLTPDNVRSTRIVSVSEQAFPPELNIYPSNVEKLIELSAGDKGEVCSFFDRIRKLS